MQEAPNDAGQALTVADVQDMATQPLDFCQSLFTDGACIDLTADDDMSVISAPGQPVRAFCHNTATTPLPAPVGIGPLPKRILCCNCFSCIPDMLSP